jgi:hypothetical protein
MGPTHGHRMQSLDPFLLLHPLLLQPIFQVPAMRRRGRCQPEALSESDNLKVTGWPGPCLADCDSESPDRGSRVRSGAASAAAAAVSCMSHHGQSLSESSGVRRLIGTYPGTQCAAGAAGGMFLKSFNAASLAIAALFAPAR